MSGAKIVIPGQLPDQNEIIAESKKGRGRWQPYNDMKQEHTNKVAWIAKTDIKKEFKKIDIVIRWVCPNRKKDKDNIMAGTKFILDGLVLAGIIKNDGWKQVGDIDHRWAVDKDNPRVEVSIKEVAE
jgi:Holliday junction resolvase RusA-like endonuclease